MKTFIGIALLSLSCFGQGQPSSVPATPVATPSAVSVSVVVDGKTVTLAMSKETIASFVDASTAAGGAAKYSDVGQYLADMILFRIVSAAKQMYPSASIKAAQDALKAAQDADINKSVVVR